MFQYIKVILSQVDDLKPSKNPNWAWCFCFFPAAIGYFLILMQFVNEKPIIGSVEVVDASFNRLFKTSANIEVIVKDAMNADGPLWIKDEQTSANYLLFSDAIKNRIFRWEEGNGPFTIGKSVYLEKSGCKSNITYCTQLHHPGSNAILNFQEGTAIDLLVAQSGDRSISIFFENGTRFQLATHFEDMRLNAPKDFTWSREGHIYFTDPIVGSTSISKSILSDKQLPHSGIYVIKHDAIVNALQSGRSTADITLLSTELSHPTGIALSPNGKLLYVSNSSPNKEEMFWRVYDVLEDCSLTNGRTFFHVSGLPSGDIAPGAPGGMKLDSNGNIYTAAPGGVVVFSPQGQLLGRLLIGEHVATNLAFGDGYLFITTQNAVLRVKTLTKPARRFSFSRQ